MSLPTTKSKIPPMEAPSAEPRAIAADIDAAKEEERKLARKRRGRLSTVLTGGLGGGADTQKQSLLGA